jgi:hypothetical protein
MKMPHTFENNTLWQKNWSFHIPDKVQAKKVPMKIKKCTTLHNLENKWQALK